MQFSNAVAQLGTEVSSMAHGTATAANVLADVLMMDQNHSRVVEEDARVHDAGPPGIIPQSPGAADGPFGAVGSETEPERREPSEVITEVAPEVAPAETEPKRPEPSEVITEVAPERPAPDYPIPEVAPERPIVEIAPERPEPDHPIPEVAPERPKPGYPITEVAPERPEPSEVIPEVAPEPPKQD
jgi:hypothetical protein